MNILAVIPARAGSKGIPNKNIRIIGEHPLVYYAIHNALVSQLITDVVVTTDSKVPWFVDEEHEKVLYPFIVANPSVIIVNFHQEQIGSKSSENAFLPRTPYTLNGCFHFAWGSNFYKFLTEAGVSPERVYITGNMRTDFTDFGDNNRQGIIDKYHLDNTKKIILFAENRGYNIQRIDSRFTNLLIKRGLTEESINQRREYEIISLKKFVEDLQSLDESFWRNYQMIYRPHPGTNPPDGIPDNVHIISDLSIYNWINTCDIFVTCGSTSAFEADMCGKICLIYDNVNEPEDQKIAGLNYYHHIKLLQDIADLDFTLEDILKRQVNEKNYQKYMGTVDGCSCDRVAEALSMLAETDKKNEIAQNYAKPSAEEVMRYKLYEKTTWLMTKTGLLYKFKFPRSAYAESRDIPYSKDAVWTHTSSTEI